MCFVSASGGVSIAITEFNELNGTRNVCSSCDDQSDAFLSLMKGRMKLGIHLVNSVCINSMSETAL